MHSCRNTRNFHPTGPVTVTEHGLDGYVGVNSVVSRGADFQRRGTTAMSIPVTYVPYDHPAARRPGPAVKSYRPRTRHLPTDVVEDPQAFATVVILASRRGCAVRRSEPGNVSARIIPLSPARRIINDARRRWGFPSRRSPKSTD